MLETILVLTLGRVPPLARDWSFNAFVWVSMVKNLKYNKTKWIEGRKYFPTVHGSQLYIGAPKKKPVSDKHGNCHNSLQLPSYAVEPATKSYKAIMCPMATLQKVSTCNYFSSKGVADCGCECCETFLHQQTLPLKPKGHFLGVGKSVSHNKLGDYPLVRGH